MVARNPPAFGALLRRHRTTAALSQEELAERAGVSVRALSDLERGVHRAPRLETVRMLAEALALGEDDRAELLAVARPEASAAPSVAHQRSSRQAPLPIPPTRLIGRESEVAELSDLLAQDDVRLVTLTGPGGTGKTHLALQVAASVQNRYQDGVVFADLSAITDSGLVLPAIATALEVRETADAPSWKTISDALRGRELLLVLDNCEQVLAAASDVANLLAACPHLSILASSREPLHVRAEREIAVLPLPLPDPGRLPPVTELAGVAAVALFVERAQAAHAGFALTAENAAAVAGICRRLDGLPLAIELAAARIKVLPPAALLARLEQRLSLLTGGGRDLPARQRTMRDAIAWSYDLLSPAEQKLFRRLAIISGAFTLAAAEAVATPEEDLPVFDGIAALIEQSLLRQAAGPVDEPRFVMLEIVREFGLEMLAAAKETEVSRERHARYFLGPDDVPTPFAPVFDAPESAALLAAERDNVRLALMWLEERGQMDALLGRLILLYRLWFAPGLHRESQQWIERALERSREAAPRVRFRALDAAMTMAQHGGNHARAAEFADEGLALARELGDLSLVGEALTNAGHVAYRLGEYGRAEEQLLEAHRLLRERVERDSDGTALLILGDTALAQEQFDRAVAWYEEAIEQFQTTGYPWGLSDARAGLAGAHFCLGDLAPAARLYGDSLGRAQDQGLTMLVLSSLFGIAALAGAAGQPRRGAHLLGAAEALAESLGAPIYPRDMPVRERGQDALQAALGKERLAAAREAGRALSLEAAIGEAKAVVQNVMRSLT